MLGFDASVNGDAVEEWELDIFLDISRCQRQNERKYEFLPRLAVDEPFNKSSLQSPVHSGDVELGWSRVSGKGANCRVSVGSERWSRWGCDATYTQVGSDWGVELKC